MSVHGSSAGEPPSNLFQDELLDEDLDLLDKPSQLAAEAAEAAGCTTPPRATGASKSVNTTPTSVCAPVSSTQGSPGPGGKVCLACTAIATKGSLCAKHKRVSDNLYNDEKKAKAQDPDRWKRFMAMRKAQGPDWIQALIDAEAAKGGNPGSGRSTGSYVAMVSTNTLSQRSSIDSEFFNKLMNARMFAKKIREEWGWEPKDTNEEWKRLVASAPREHIIRRNTLPGRKEEPWIYIHDFDAIVGGQGLRHSSDIQMREKEKKNPQASDIDEAVSGLSSEAVHFSDNFFSQMSAAAIALGAVKDSNSSVVDGSGRSLVFSESLQFRDKAAQPASSKQKDQEKDKKKGKSKPFVLEDLLDGLDIRLKKRFDSMKKVCDDLCKEVTDFINKELQENLSKVQRVASQVQSRLIVVKAMSTCLDSLPDSLDFSLKELDLDAAVASEIQKLVEPDVHGAQYKFVLSLCKHVAAARDQVFAASDEQVEATEARVMQAVSEYVADFSSKSFAVNAPNDGDEKMDGSDKEFQPVFFREKDMLQGVLSMNNWAGSGFSSPPDWDTFAVELDEIAKAIFLGILADCSVSYFLSIAKPMLEPGQMKEIYSLQYVAFKCRVQFRMQADEDGIKRVENQNKNDMDFCKTVVQAVRSSFQTLQKHSRELRRESARMQSQQEKERLAAEKQKEKEQKSRLRSIADQMKGSDKLPGLLAYCGSWVKAFVEFKTLDEFRAGKAQHDVKQPFIITDVTTLRDEDATSNAKVNFSLFKAGHCVCYGQTARQQQKLAG